MGRRKRKEKQPSYGSPHVPLVLDWIVSYSMTVNGRAVEPGTELKIRGERGRFLFVKHVARPSGIEWVDVIHSDSRGASTGWRSFRPERIRTVHRIKRSRANAARSAS